VTPDAHQSCGVITKSGPQGDARRCDGSIRQEPAADVKGAVRGLPGDLIQGRPLAPTIREVNPTATGAEESVRNGEVMALSTGPQHCGWQVRNEVSRFGKTRASVLRVYPDDFQVKPEF